MSININGCVVNSPAPWDDIFGNVAAGGGKKVDGDPPEALLHAYGTGSGDIFLGQSFAIEGTAHMTIQTPHAMKMNGELHQHFHYTPADSTSGWVRFRLDAIFAGVFHNWTEVVGSPFEVEFFVPLNTNNKHCIVEMAELPPINPTVSSIVKMRLKRIAATSGTDYSGGIFVEYFDGHIQKNSDGSDQEYYKSF